MSMLPEEARREKIRAALQAHDPGQEESVRVPWKDDTQLCPVVQIPLEATVLNPKSHRIRSELESDPHANVIKADPFSLNSQERIADILRRTDGFDDLRDSVDEEGQRDYGVLTEAGVLVNANTRAVALEELGRSHIKVAVLPGDAGEREIADLEIRLQMQRDLKQSYSFTNELLFVEDLLSGYGYTSEQVAKVLRRSVRDIDAFVRMLALARDIQRRSDRRVRLIFFDDKEQALKDLDASYESLRARDPNAARRLKDARLLGLLAGSFYRDLREADENFASDYLFPVLQEKETLSRVQHLLQSESTSEGGEELEGVDDLLGEDGGDGDDGGEVDLSKLVGFFAEHHRQEHVTLPGDGGPEQVEQEPLLAELSEAISEAAEEAKADRKREKGLEGPTARLREARKALRKTRTEYRAVAGYEGFAHGAFVYEARKLQGDVDAIHAEIQKRER